MQTEQARGQRRDGLQGQTAVCQDVIRHSRSSHSSAISNQRSFFKEFPFCIVTNGVRLILKPGAQAKRSRG